MTRCVLHIGTAKTGTTVLQEWLYDNQKTLSDLGIYLSDTIGRTNNRLVPLYFQRRLDDWARARGILSKKQKDIFFEGFLDKLSAEIRDAASSHDTYVITSEHLHSRLTSREEVCDLYGFLVNHFEKITVVCYFRDQYDSVVSLYSTALKGASKEKLDSFIDRATPDNPYFNILEIADTWSSIFGRENCIFQIYDRTEFVESDLRKDFIQAVAPYINLACLNYDRKISNESLTLLQAAAFRAINSTVPHKKPGIPGLNRRNILLKKAVLGIEELKSGKIRSHKRIEVQQRFDASNAQFFSKYFGSENRFRNTEPETNFTDSATDGLEALVDKIMTAALKVFGTTLDTADGTNSFYGPDS